MNLQEFNNLKIGDKVVVASIRDTTSSRYSPEVIKYLGAHGKVTEKYYKGCHKSESGIRIKFSNGCEWFYNVEDVELINKSEKETKTPHKHAAIIKAWADGEEIEMKDIYGKWVDVTNRTPSWLGDEYRIKPKFEKRYLYTYLSSRDGWTLSNQFYSEARWKELWGHLESQKIEASGKDFQVN